MNLNSLAGNRVTARETCTNCMDSNKKNRYIQARGARRERKLGEAMAIPLFSPCCLFGLFRTDYLFLFRGH